MGNDVLKFRQAAHIVLERVFGQFRQTGAMITGIVAGCPDSRVESWQRAHLGLGAEVFGRLAVGQVDDEVFLA